MNLIAFRRPTHIYWSDSCLFGLGGYSDIGFAWRFEIPEALWFRASNNLLEYLASIISPWVDMLAGSLKQEDCALLMTDSWLRKTNFQEIIGDALTQFKQKSASRLHDITPPTSLRKASRNTPSGSLDAKTTSPMPFHVILIKLTTN